MSVRIILVSNVLNPSEGREIRDLEFQPDRTMAQYLADVLPAEALAVSTASCNGHVWPRSLWEMVHLRDGDCLVVAPEVGNEGVWRTLAQVGVMAAAVVAGVFLTPIIGPIAAGLVSSAIATGGNLLIQTFMPLQPSTKAQTPSYAYDGPQSLAQPGTVIPKGYGMFMWGGNIIDGFTDIEGTKQYVNALVCFGFGPARAFVGPGYLSGIQINGKAIEDYQDIEYYIRYGTNDQTPIGQFNRIVNGYPQDTQVTAAGGPVIVPGTGDLTQALQVDIEFPVGVYYISGDGNELPCQIIYKVEYSVSGEGDWQPVMQPYTTESVIVYHSDGSVNVEASPVWGVFPNFMPPGSGVVLATDGASSDHYPGEPWSGTETLVTVDETGDETSTEMSLAGEWQPINVNMNIVEVTRWTNGWVKFVADTTEAIYNRTSIYGLAPNKYDVRVTKYGSNNASNTVEPGDFDSPKRGQEVWIHNVNEIQYQNLSYPNMILLGIRALATNQINGTAMNITATIQHGLRTLDLGLLPAELQDFEEDNPACVAADMMLDPLYGGGSWPGILPANITRQIEQWVAWAELNDELVDDGSGNSIRRHVCNGVFDQEDNLWQALQKVTAMSRAAIVPMGLDYGVFVDREDVPVQMFTMGSILQDSFSETWLAIDARANQIEVQFADSTRQYRQDNPIVYISPNDQDAGVPIKNTRLNGWGITIPAQAWHFGRFKGLCTDLLLRTGSFRCDVAAIACRPGDLIYLQHDVPKWGWGGRTLPSTADLQNSTSLINIDRTDLPAPGIASDNSLNPAATAYNLIVLHPSLQRYAGIVNSVDSTQTVLGLSSFDGVNRVTRAVINGTDCAILQSSAGTIVIEGPPGFVPEVGQAYTLYDTDVMEVRGVTAILPGAEGVSAQLQLAAPLSRVPQDYSSYLYGPAGTEAQIVRVLNVQRAGDQHATIEWIDYNAGCYVDATPTIGEVSAVVTTNPGVTDLAAEESFQVQPSGSYDDFVVLTWKNGQNTAGVGIYGYFAGQTTPQMLARLVGNQTSWKMQVKPGFTWTFIVVGFDSNDNYAAWATAPTVTITTVGITENLLQSSSFQGGFAYWNLTPRAGDTLAPTFQNDGQAQYAVNGSALTVPQTLLYQVIPISKWTSASEFMLSAYFTVQGTPVGNLVADICFTDGSGTVLGTARAAYAMAGAAAGPLRVNSAVAAVPEGTVNVLVRVLVDGSTLNLPVGTVLTFDHLLLENASAGQTAPSAWADIGVNGQVLDIFTLGSSSGLRTQASAAPTFTGSVSYSYTDDSITISWSSLVIQWPDGSFTYIQDGSLEITALTASTTYWAFLYFDVVNGGVVAAVPTTPLGTPAILSAAYDATADAACRRDGRVSLTPGGMQMGTASEGGSGGGSGGGGIPPHGPPITGE